MTSSDESDCPEYTALLAGGRDANRTGQLCWTACAIAAAILLSGALAAKSPALMLPVLVCVAAGFYANLRARRHVRLVAGYVEEFYEGREGRDGRDGRHWFTRMRNIAAQPGFGFPYDWVSAILANGLAVATVAFAWMFAEDAWRGELMAGFVTGCAIVFAFHSLAETSRLRTTDFAAMWRQAAAEAREPRRVTRMAAR